MKMLVSKKKSVLVIPASAIRFLPVEFEVGGQPAAK
jgi:hypothetical protein